MRLFVNGTLMRGLALHANLDGATFVGERVTAPRYRLHSVRDAYPGMYEVKKGGIAVRGELYEISADHCGRVMASEPPGLYLGQVVLDDGEEVNGVLCRPDVAATHRDISGFGGWRAYCDTTPPEHVRTDEAAHPQPEGQSWPAKPDHTSFPGLATAGDS